MVFTKLFLLLFVGLYWAIFCVYNTGTVTLSLPGFKTIQISLSLCVLFVFLFGVCLAAFSAVVDHFQQWSQIKKLKKRVAELEKLNNSQESQHT